jgi:Ran-binding protein 9/10
VTGGRGAQTVKVVTGEKCKNSCLLSDLPIMAGLDDVKGKLGVYFEVRMNKMNEIVAIGERNTHIISHLFNRHGM